MPNSDSSLVTGIIVFILILIVLFYLTKYLRNKPISLMKSKYIKVLDKLVLSNDKVILVVEIFGAVQVVCMTNESTYVLEKISLEEFCKYQNVNEDEKFTTIFQKVINIKNKGKGEKKNEK